jgi:hypothetical protein
MLSVLIVAKREYPTSILIVELDHEYTLQAAIRADFY